MKIIVSFTTYPARINTIDRCLEAMIRQTIKPDKIILYLAENQFPEKKLSIDLTQYQEDGFEIHWCQEDLGPHKKYYYAMQEFPEDIIITIDDDFWYPETLVEDLIRGYQKFPMCIIARCAHLITALPDGSIAPYAEWYIRCEKYVNEPKMNLFAVGCGGILYPPKLLPGEVFNKTAILDFCWHGDDLWLKIMELTRRIPTVLVTKWFNDRPMQEYKEDGLFANVNKDGGNDKTLAELLEYYNKLEDEQDTLVDRVFADGVEYASEIKKAICSAEERIVNAFLMEIKKEKKVLIYGAGIIAKRLYSVMSRKEYALVDKIKAFIVSDVLENEQNIDGIPVYAWHKCIDGAEKIVLAVSEDKQWEIYNSLEKCNVNLERIIRIKDRENWALKGVEGKEREKRKKEQIKEFKERANDCSQIVIYGAGVYGKRVLKKLYEWDIHKKTVFAVTEVPEIPEIMGLEVYSIKAYEDAPEDIFVIPAVGVSLNAEMVSNLEKLNVKNYMELSDELREEFKETKESFYQRMLKQQPYQRILEQQQRMQKEQSTLSQQQRTLDKQQQSMLELQQCMQKEQSVFCQQQYTLDKQQQSVLEQQQHMQKEQSALSQQQSILDKQQQNMLQQQQQSMLQQQQDMLEQRSILNKQQEGIIEQTRLLEQQQELLKEIYQNIYQLTERLDRLENAGIDQMESKLRLNAIYDMLKGRKA